MPFIIDNVIGQASSPFLPSRPTSNVQFRDEDVDVSSTAVHCGTPEDENTRRVHQSNPTPPPRDTQKKEQDLSDVGSQFGQNDSDQYPQRIMKGDL